MTKQTEPKAVSVTIDSKARMDLDTIQNEWPVTQSLIVAAALERFRKLTPDERAESIRHAQQRRAG